MQLNSYTQNVPPGQHRCCQTRRMEGIDHKCTRTIPGRFPSKLYIMYYKNHNVVNPVKQCSIVLAIIQPMCILCTRHCMFMYIQLYIQFSLIGQVSPTSNDTILEFVYYENKETATFRAGKCTHFTGAASRHFDERQFSEQDGGTCRSFTPRTVERCNTCRSCSLVPRRRPVDRWAAATGRPVGGGDQ